MLTELNLPFEADEGAKEFVDQLQPQLPAELYHHLTELITEQVINRDYSYADEFAYGLDLILDSLEARLVMANRG